MTAQLLSFYVFTTFCERRTLLMHFMHFVAIAVAGIVQCCAMFPPKRIWFPPQAHVLPAGVHVNPLNLNKLSF
jgi:hypothetical protein